MFFGFYLLIRLMFAAMAGLLVVSVLAIGALAWLMLRVVMFVAVLIGFSLRPPSFNPPAIDRRENDEALDHPVSPARFSDRS